MLSSIFDQLIPLTWVPTPTVFSATSNRISQDIGAALSPEMLQGIGSFLVNEIEEFDRSPGLFWSEWMLGSFITDIYTNPANNAKVTWGDAMVAVEWRDGIWKEWYELVIAQLKLARYLGVVIPSIPNEAMVWLDSIDDKMAVDYLQELLNVMEAGMKH